MEKYHEIAQYVEHQIESNVLLPRSRLPSVRNLSDHFQCSAGTVVKAYELLVKRHVVYTVPRSGYFVMASELSFSDHKENDLIDFATAAPDIDMLPYQDIQHCLNNAIDMYKYTLFAYGEPQGLPTLIRFICRHLHNYQIFSKPENIAICTGSQQALNILTQLPFPNGNKKILIEQPTYYGMIRSVEINSADVLGITRDFNGLDMTELEQIFQTGKIKFFYTIPRYHNPTGQSYTREEKKAIVRLAEKYNVYILEDDIMADFDPDTKSDPLFSLDTSNHVIYLKSYSKILMPGLRIAALVLPPAIRDDFLHFKFWNDMGSPVLSQGALEIYLKSGMFNSHRKKILDIHQEKMAAFKAATQEADSSLISWNIPNSGFFVCAHIEGHPHCNHIDAYLQEQGIKILDTRECFLPQHQTDRYFRFCVSKPTIKQIHTGVAAFAEAVRRFTIT